MVKLGFSLIPLALAAASFVSAVPLEERKVSVIHDNDLVDAKGLKLDLDLLNNLHILKRKATTYKYKSDNDLLDLKNLKINLDLLNNLHILKRKASTFTSDNDLIDLKGLGINLDLLNNVDLLKRGKTTVYSDNDLLDLKNLKINLNLLNNLQILLKHLHLLKRGEEIIGDIVARSEAPAGLEERGRCNTKIVSDNDLLDLKNLKAFLNILRRDEPADDVSAIKRNVFYSDNDLLDLKNLGVNINVLSGKPRYCIPVHRPKPTPKPTHKPTPKPRPTTTRKTTKKPCTTSTRKPTPKPTHKPKPPTCGHGFDYVSPGSTYGSVYTSDNDLLDLKDLSINVCILDFSGKCGKDSGRKQPNWTCQNSAGCCVKKGSKTVVKDDDDLLDLKNIGINLGILNF